MIMEIYNQNNNQYQLTCMQNNNDITACGALNRLIQSMIYCETLNIEETKESQDIFIHFIQEIYGIANLIDDYCHVIEIHDNNDDIAKINEHILVSYKKCNILQCSFTTRHFQNELRYKPDAELEAPKIPILDNTLKFIQSLMDNNHVRLMHSFETGHRRHNQEINDEKVDEKNDEKVDDDNNNDSKNAFNRFYNNKNCKFVLSLGQPKSDKTTTFMDQFCSFISMQINDTQIYRDVVIFLYDNEFDSDAINDDMDDLDETKDDSKDNNDILNTYDDEYYKLKSSTTTKKFIKDLKCM